MLKSASHADSGYQFIEIPGVDNACIVVTKSGIMLHMGVPVLFAKGMYAVTMCNLMTIKGSKGNLMKAIEFFDDFCVACTGHDKSRIVNPDWAYITPRNKAIRLLDGNKYECSLENGWRKVDIGNATISFPE